MNKEELYTQIEQKMDELLGICSDAKIPFFSTFAKEKDGKTEYVSRVGTPLSLDVELTDDKITPFNAALSNDIYLKIKQDPEDISIADVMDTFSE